MKSVREFCLMIELEDEIAEDVINLESKVSNTLGNKLLSLAEEAVKDGITDKEFQILLKTAEEYGQTIDEHPYRMQMIFSYYCFALLEDKFLRAGIRTDIYKATVSDFKFRIYECREVYGFNGIFVAWWYSIACNLSLYKIGELEFEKTVAGFNYGLKGVKVKEGDEIIALHIPPKTKINKEAITKAIKESYDYFGFSGKVAYQCESWLLYPAFANVFVKGGNVMEFRALFDILSSTDTATFEDCWRVFKVGEIVNLDSLPRNTRLQENMYNHLKKGNPTGYGFGVLVFDGENVI